jgi:P-type Mg2+ transporter
MVMVAMAIPWVPSVNTALKFIQPDGEFYGFLAVFVVAYALTVHVGKTIYVATFKEWL